MSNEFYERKRRVARQSWKPNHLYTVLRGIWMAAYSVFKVAAAAIATVLGIIIVCGFVFVSTLAAYLEKDIIPMADTLLEGMGLNQNSVAYYVDDEGEIRVLQELYASVNREWVSYEDIPEDLIHATVAIEDKRFYEHQGVDWFTTIKACINMFLGADSQFGGSCITQQLVKNITGDDDVTVQRKVLEIFKATELERRYDKETILEWYLNWIYLGQRRNGVKAAAEIYFGKELEDLTTAECASLISITNNPSKYDPYRQTLDKDGKTGYEQNMYRKEVCLKEMLSLGWLTQEEFDEAMAQEIVLKWGVAEEDRNADCNNEGCGYRGTIKTFTVVDGQYFCPKCGLVTTIGEDASQEVYSYFMDTVLEDVCEAFAKRDGIEWNDVTKDLYKTLVSSGGYHIYTTFDMNVQNAIDQIYTNLDEIPEDRSVQQLQSAIVIIDNRSGDIVGMAGGVGEKVTHDGLNRATDSDLQPGSAIKPLTVYGPAFELGVITPATVIKDLPMYYYEADKKEDDETETTEQTDPTEETDEDEEEEEDDNLLPFPRNSAQQYSYMLSIQMGIAWSFNTTAVNVLDTIGTGYSYEFAKYKMGLSALTDHFVSFDGRVFSDVGYAPLALGAPTVGVTVRQMTNAYSSFANDGIYRNARTFTKVYDSRGNLVLDNTQKSEKLFGEKAVDYMTYCMDMATRYGSGDSGQIDGHPVASKTGTTNDTKDRWYCGFTGYYTCAVWCGYDTPETIIPVGDQTNPAGRLWKKVMEPLHKDLDPIELYDESKFLSVSICTDCGNVADEKCYLDPRALSGYGRVEYIKLYEEDVPEDVCDCHMEVQFCPDSDCVANEYCHKFAEAGEIELLDRSLVKITEDLLKELQAAAKHGLQEIYQTDNWIYLMKDNGKPGSFTGIHEDINEDVDEPYQVCTEHTEESWEEYLESKGQSGPTKPSKPSKPTEPTDPAEPTNPSEPTKPTEDEEDDNRRP